MRFLYTGAIRSHQLCFVVHAVGRGMAVPEWFGARAALRSVPGRHALRGRAALPRSVARGVAVGAAAQREGAACRQEAAAPAETAGVKNAGAEALPYKVRPYHPDAAVVGGRPREDVKT